MDKALAPPNNKDTQIALLVIDLNGFKRVNDNFGHGAGDEVLREVGQRLRKTVRDGDSPFRIGGDEFAVVMTNSVSVETAKRLAERISGDLGAPYDLVSGAVNVGASVGISHAPADGTNVETLVKTADRRMYANKDRTRQVPVPNNEAGRLRDLLSYEVLDTPAEESFDRITRLASAIIGTPIALVSLVDDQRQWFKSKIGLDADQTPRDVAFCAHAIAGDEVMIVPDTQGDERFVSNPLVTDDPNIRFYAGAPLKSRTGHNLGTLCIIDRVPRSLNKEQQQSLADLASLVVRELEMRKSARKDDR